MANRLSRFRRRPLALVAGLLFSASVMAQSPREVDIASQRLDQALNTLAQQTGAQIIFSSAVAESYVAPSVKGALTTRQALQRLLSGSGLRLQEQGDGVFVVVDGERSGQSGDAKTLDEVKVVGRLIDTLSMMKRGETLRDTPQAVTIMTRQRIDEQKLVTVSEVLEQTPGVTVDADFFGRPNTYLSRGFEITNIQIDGASVDVGRSYYFNPNLAMYEQVEVLRGADGLFAGNGDPGGTVNLARKRALSVPQLLVDVSASRWDSFSTQVDVSSPLGWDGRVRGRMVANWYDKEFYYDTAKDKGTFLYGTVEADLGDNTVVIAGASVEDTDQKPWLAGLPRYSTGDSLGLPREVSLMADWSTWDSHAKEYFLRVEHVFNSNWMAAASVTQGHSQVYVLSGAAYGYSGSYSNPGIEPGTTRGSALGTGYDYDSERTIYDVSVQGKFQAFGHQHSVLLGFDKQNLDNVSAPMRVEWDGSVFGPMVDIFDFDSASIPYPSTVYRLSYGNNITRQQGVYGKAQLQLSEPLRLVIGGRYFNYDFYRPSTNYDSAGQVISTGATGYKEDGVFNPYVGALFDLNKQWTLYGSITEIYRTQASYLSGPPPGKTLDPMTGRNYELGTKAELRDGRMGFSFALYRTERNGQAEQDFNYPPSMGGDFTGNCCYLELGEVLSQGIDVEVTGELTPGWSLSAGYTLNENENKRSGSVFSSRAPKHILKVWSTYLVPRTGSRLSLGGGFTAQTERYISGIARAYNPVSGLYDGANIPFDYSQGSYAVVNAMLRYKVSETWSLSLNVNNLLDRTYYRGLGGGLASGNYYGEPRNFVLSMRGKF